MNKSIRQQSGISGRDRGEQASRAQGRRADQEQVANRRCAQGPGRPQGSPAYLTEEASQAGMEACDARRLIRALEKPADGMLFGIAQAKLGAKRAVRGHR